MRVVLEYGRTGLEVELPHDRVVHELGYQPVAPLEEPEQVLRALLAQPLGSPPLAELARGRRDACILICDITRPVPNALMLGPILETLEAAGIARHRILILVATGLHRPNEGEELVEMVGQEIVDRYRIVNHRGCCRDVVQAEIYGLHLEHRIVNHRGCCRDEHTYLGDSPGGVPVWIDSRYVEADLKLAIGLIDPHFMAGFSGGRKLICPGIAALETVRAWHSPRFLEDRRSDCGILQGNPVHEENTWIARRAGCDFIANVVLDDQRQPLHFVAGDMEQAFERGCDFVRRVVTDSIPEPADIVVTSSAGYPLDTTFYQSIKGLAAALPIVKPGGTIILAASLSEGVGSEAFSGLFREHASPAAFVERILRDPDYFVMDQWQLEKMAAVCRQAKIVVVSDGLPAGTLERLFVRPAESVESAVGQAIAEYGSQATLAVIPKGPYVLAQVAAD